MRTVENAGKIVVLSDGAVTEMGTSHELLRRKGIFGRMVKLQRESQDQALT